MRRFIVVLCGLMLVLAVGLNLVATVPAAAGVNEVWVAPPPTGNDSNPGTEAAPFATITKGIQTVPSPGTVHVAAGTYGERITLLEGIQVVGAGQDVTTINGSGGGSVVTASGVTSATKLDGFTITNGWATYGGGMCNTNHAEPTVTNCTFPGNTADENGGGTYNQLTSFALTLTNCILWGNSAGYGGNELYNDVVDPIFNPTVVFCDIQGGYPGTGNIDADPSFVNAVAGDYHLTSVSPCVDTGNSTYSLAYGLTVDFEGDQRFWDGDDDTVIIVDMGADEFLPQEVWVDAVWAGSAHGQTVDGHVFGIDAFDNIQDGMRSSRTHGQCKAGDISREHCYHEEPDTTGYHWNRC